MLLNNLDACTPETHNWDAIVIGTGIGGSTLGWALARAGLRVLFLEKGRSHLHHADAFRGDYADRFLSADEGPALSSPDVLRRSGRAWQDIVDSSYPKPRRFVPFLGCGIGGSSALYGMACERFFPEDFRPTWPVSYQQMQPYYEAAERLYGVCGGTDPLRENHHGSDPRPNNLPPLNAPHQKLLSFLKSSDLHPYRLPLACNYKKGDERAQGYLDNQGSKNEAGTVCLNPALDTHGAQLLDECEVMRLETDQNVVREIVCLHRGRLLTLRSNLVILAAGALASPAILLKSSSPHWPRGLANRSDQVGRNLMRHYVDLYVLKGLERSENNFAKQLAFNDYYSIEGKRFGTVQSFGALPPADILAREMREELQSQGRRFSAAMLGLGRSIVQRTLKRLLQGRTILASVMEDRPHSENRVRPLAENGDKNQSNIEITYRIRSSEADRIKFMRRRMLRLLKPLRPMLIKQAENNQRMAHICGTCRFGEDPKTSVLNADNRAHDVENLYVVDTSFFPTSTGMNPALTVAANALRVAEKISGATAQGANDEH